MTQLTPYREYLLLGKLSNTLDEDEVRAWNLLLQQNPEVAVAYEQMAQQLPVDKLANGFQEADAPEFWDDLEAQLRHKAGVPSTTRPRALHFLHKYRAAAAVVLVVMIAAAFLWYSAGRQGDTLEYATATKPPIELKLAGGAVINLSARQGNINANGLSFNNSGNALTFKTEMGSLPNSTNMLTVPAGLDYKVHLEDGTEVWLNSASALQFPSNFKGTTREVSIRGEAYFKVAKNPGKPFIVHLPKSTVRVLGTEFNVNTYSEDIETIALLAGSVHLQTPAGEGKLSPGKEAVYIEGKPILIQNFDPDRTLSWQKGLFYFDEMKLSDICFVISRWYGMKVTIDNPSTGNKKIVGLLDRKLPISIFLDDLRIIAGVDAYIDKENVLHFK